MKTYIVHYKVVSKVTLKAPSEKEVKGQWEKVVKAKKKGYYELIGIEEQA